MTMTSNQIKLEVSVLNLGLSLIIMIKVSRWVHKTIMIILWLSSNST